MYSDLENDIN
jgi:hypothetical protein